MEENSSLPMKAGPQVQNAAQKASEGDDIVARLRERQKLKYMGDCKCGHCQLVHINDVIAAADEIERLRALMRENRARVISSAPAATACAISTMMI